MKIKINPLTALMFLAIALTGNIKLYLMAYTAMAVHELAHFLAAKYIGLKSQSITFSPFGVHLTLENKLIHSMADEVILYSAGPLVNVILALTAVIIKDSDLYRVNTTLFVMNILPIMPLDGGMIALRLMSCRFGRRCSKRLLNAFSISLGVVLIILSVSMLYIDKINISLFVIAILFIGNVLTSKEMYDTDFINALSSRKKHTNKTNLVIINDRFTIADAIKGFSPSYTTIGIRLNDDGDVSEILSENAMISNLDILE